jgi:hypothetical protein
MSVVGFDLGNESSVIAVAKNRGIDVLQVSFMFVLGSHRVVFVAASRMCRLSAPSDRIASSTRLIRIVNEARHVLSQSYLPVDLRFSLFVWNVMRLPRPV